MSDEADTLKFIDASRAMTQPTQDPCRHKWQPEEHKCSKCGVSQVAKLTPITPATKPLDELLSNPDKSNTTKSGFEITFDPVHLRAEIQALITNAEKQAYLNGYTQAKAETMLENL